LFSKLTSIILLFNNMPRGAVAVAGKYGIKLGSQVKTYVNTVTTKKNIGKGVSRTGHFVVEGLLEEARSQVIDKLLHHKDEDKDDQDKHLQKTENNITKTVSEQDEGHHSHHQSSPSLKSAIKNEDGLPPSELVYLTIVEGGVKRVFLAEIEYISKYSGLLFCTAKIEKRTNYKPKAILKL
jgi:hypothetical protein